MTRGVPNFLVAGAAKAGTTSLSYYLRQHPDVFTAREKESHHFLFPGTPAQFTGPGDDRELNKMIIPDLDRYAACFDGATGERAVGESSVFYVYRPEALERALEFNPEMRFIVVLREPLARAYSAFSHHRRDGWEPLEDFAAAIAAEDERVAAGWSYGWHYRRVSDYAPQLKAVNDVVPPEQLRIVLYEDLVERPVETVQSLFGFLDVDDTFVCDTSLRLNMSGKPRSTTLNSLLSHSGGVKEVAKKLIPYQLGQSVQQRVRNWNLRPEELPAETRRKVEESFRFDASEMADLTHCNMDAWLPSQ